MVKADVKTPNKRKSFGNATPAKKPKLENGKNNEATPKKQLHTPKPNQQLSAQKSNKKNKPNQVSTESDSPKKIKPFAGAKRLDNTQKKQNQPKKEEESQSPDKKKKRRNQYEKLVANVRVKAGSKDQDLLKSINDKITAIKSRPDLTKTARRKLGKLEKLKVVLEEGSEAAAAKGKAKAEAKEKTEKKTAPQQAAQGNKKKAAPAQLKAANDDDSDEEEESDDEEGEEESGEEEEDSDAEAEEGGGDAGEEEDSDDDDEEEDEDDESDDEAPAPAPKGKPPSAKKPKPQTDSQEKTKPKVDPKKPVDLDKLKSNDLVTKGQKRFVLFVGNIPYDTTKQDLLTHFNKVGDILHIRIPTEQGGNRPRGFGYIEVKDETTYQKCLSMHHSQLKGRRINVLYTQGGKKKGQDRKKEIKAKNMKLHTLRKQGKLAGSVKESQKRSFRRKKSQEAQNKIEN